MGHRADAEAAHESRHRSRHGTSEETMTLPQSGGWNPYRCTRQVPVPGPALPCQTKDADLWFAAHPAQLRRAKQLCQRCPIRSQCLEGALQRREPWGVWGGQIFECGQVILFKRGRGRPAGPKTSSGSARVNVREPAVRR